MVHSYNSLSIQNLLHKLKARYLVVSFPIKTLSGREKGMEKNYEHFFDKLVDGTSWQINSLSFPTELVFVIDKSPKTQM